MAGRPVPIYYLDDDAEALQLFADSVRPNVVNQVKLFTKAEKLYAAVAELNSPCAVLVDLVLPDLHGGGYEAIAKLQSMPSFRDKRSIVIAVTSTTPDDFLLDRAREVGAHVFIHKPVEFPDLVMAIGRPGWFRVQFNADEAAASA